jgi:hypothetical protein
MLPFILPFGLRYAVLKHKLQEAIRDKTAQIYHLKEEISAEDIEFLNWNFWTKTFCLFKVIPHNDSVRMAHISGGGC